MGSLSMATKKRKDKVKLGDIVVLHWYDAASRDGWAGINTPKLTPPWITSFGAVSHQPIKDENYWNLVSIWDDEDGTQAV